MDFEVGPDMPDVGNGQVPGSRRHVLPYDDAVLEEADDTFRMFSGDLGEKACDLVGFDGRALAQLPQDLFRLSFGQIGP